MDKAGSTCREHLMYTYKQKKTHICTSCCCKCRSCVTLKVSYFQRTHSYEKEVKVLEQILCCGKALNFNVLIEWAQDRSLALLQHSSRHRQSN